MVSFYHFTHFFDTEHKVRWQGMVNDAQNSFVERVRTEVLDPLFKTTLYSVVSLLGFHKSIYHPSQPPNGGLVS